MNEYELQNTPEVGMMPKGVQTEMMISRQAQEVQVQAVLAKRFPRNEVVAFNRVMNACKRKKLAENAIYEFPRGGTKVTGPSIRLAEAIAQNWGNIDFGFNELEQNDGESTVMAYAWDLETNTRQTKIFTVKHIRHTKTKDIPLTDPRDIYELIANNAARRVRSCILSVIPGDVIDAAVDQCNKTLAGDNSEPLIDSIRKMAASFKNDYGITMKQLENYIGWNSDSFSRHDVVRLRQVYKSLRDGMAKKEDIFDMSITDTVVDALGPDIPEEKPVKGKKREAQSQDAFFDAITTQNNEAVI